jgi:excisionase family DNA binding protein
MPSPSPDDSHVTGQQAAEILGVSIRTVERMRADGELTPVYVPTPGRAVRRYFRRAEVEARLNRAAIADRSA